jgi:hypothetical protein
MNSTRSASNVTPNAHTPWMPMTAAQAQRLGRLAAQKNAPNALVISRTDSGDLICVPASRRDQRRWDISKTGTLKKKER